MLYSTTILYLLNYVIYNITVYIVFIARYPPRRFTPVKFWSPPFLLWHSRDRTAVTLAERTPTRAPVKFQLMLFT